MKNSLKESIEHAGGVAAIASHFNISQVSVYEWIKRGAVPADKCPEIEKLSCGLVRCEELNALVDWAFIRDSQSSAPKRDTDPAPDIDPDRPRRNLPDGKCVE